MNKIGGSFGGGDPYNKLPKLYLDTEVKPANLNPDVVSQKPKPAADQFRRSDSDLTSPGNPKSNAVGWEPFAVPVAVPVAVLEETGLLAQSDAGTFPPTEASQPEEELVRNTLMSHIKLGMKDMKDVSTVAAIIGGLVA